MAINALLVRNVGPWTSIPLLLLRGLTPGAEPDATATIIPLRGFGSVETTITGLGSNNPTLAVRGSYAPTLVGRGSV